MIIHRNAGRGRALSRLLVMVAIGVSCGGSPQTESETAVMPTPDADALVDQLGRAFSRAILRASESGWSIAAVESLVVLYSEDAILFPPRGAPIQGREAIRGYWTRSPGRRILDHRIIVERIEPSLSLIADQGRLHITAQDSVATYPTDTLTYLSVWRREADGHWRKTIDNWW